MKTLAPPYNYFILLISTVLLPAHTSAAMSAYPNEARPEKYGFLKVNAETGSAMFYTFYEAQSNPKATTPILIWLQGGPGCSSMMGNFLEMGPWLLNPNLTLRPNPYSWNKFFGLLFLDNPIGTGFSVAASPGEIPRNQADVAKHLFTSISEFVSLDPSFRTRPIYITGESYAGKYVPAIGDYILSHNANSSTGEGKINLAGVAIGNGLTDPENQVLTHAANCYNLGLINQAQRIKVEKIQSDAAAFARSGKWEEATKARNNVLTSIGDMTDLPALYDFRRLKRYRFNILDDFLNQGEVKRALGVNESVKFRKCSSAVWYALHLDVMKSVRYMVERLVKQGTKVLLYQGQCDLTDGVVSNLAWVEKMDWDEIQGFLDAKRRNWIVGGELAGYGQKWKNFSHVVVLNSGHFVPYDQPVNSLAMIQDWIVGRGFFV